MFSSLYFPAGHTLNKMRRTAGFPRLLSLAYKSHLSLAAPPAVDVWSASFLRPRCKASRAVASSATTNTTVSEDTGDSGLAEKTTWDLRGLKKETGRQVMRQWKRVSKADERVKKVNLGRLPSWPLRFLGFGFYNLVRFYNFQT